MNENRCFQRLALLVGSGAVDALARARTVVFGLGGVGSWCAEALVRSGVGNITLVDFDTVDITNVNRQIEALQSTVGRPKAEVLAERFADINPGCKITVIPRFFSAREKDLPTTAADFGIPDADYVIDAIDSIESKLDLIEAAGLFGVTLFSSMGMARKLNPARLRVAGIWKTGGCPLARRVREGLRKRNFGGDFTTVYSDEKLPPAGGFQTDETDGKAEGRIAGSAVTVTAAAGMMLAGLVLQDIAERGGNG